MAIKTVLANNIKKIDLFPTSAFIRYKGESDYTIVTGGCTSIIVIIALIALFFTEGLKTVKKEIIYA